MNDKKIKLIKIDYEYYMPEFIEEIKGFVELQPMYNKDTLMAFTLVDKTNVRKEDKNGWW